MTTIRWRPEVNALTTPQSYRPRCLPRDTVGYNELAAEIVRDNPNYNEALVKSVMTAMTEKIKEQLINGNQVTLEGAFTYHLSLTARLDDPDEPLPPVDKTVQVRVYASSPFIDDVRHGAEMERLPVSKKLPVISAAEDIRLNLNDVLYEEGVLKLTGSNLLFDPAEEGCECAIIGSRSGKAFQDRFASISNTEILVVPRIPAQDDPWNNEYTLYLTTRYTENGTLRTGSYQRRLRSPLTLADFGKPHPPEVGILTGEGTAPYVTVTGGALAADETLRIQTVLDMHEGYLLFNLIDMTEGGKSGGLLQVTANGAYSLTGFVDSALSDLEITVNKFDDLVLMIRNAYSGRLVDILNMRVAA